MPYSIEYDPVNHIVRGKVWGKVSRDTLREYTKEGDMLLKEKNCAFTLSDYRQARITFSLSQVFNLPDQYAQFVENLNGNVHKLKRAILIEVDKEQLFNFFETVSVNRGQNVKVFTDEAAACAWLQS